VLEDLERRAQHFVVPHAKRILDGDDELWDYGEDFGATVLKHVVDTLACKELVGMGCLAETIEEKREVVVVVQLLNLDLPCNFVALCVVLECDGEVAPLVELAEAGWGHGAGLEGSGVGRAGHLPLELFLLLALALDHFAGFTSSANNLVKMVPIG